MVTFTDVDGQSLYRSQEKSLKVNLSAYRTMHGEPDTLSVLRCQ